MAQITVDFNNNKIDLSVPCFCFSSRLFPLKLHTGAEEGKVFYGCTEFLNEYCSLREQSADQWIAQVKAKKQSATGQQKQVLCASADTSLLQVKCTSTHCYKVWWVEMAVGAQQLEHCVDEKKRLKELQEWQHHQEYGPNDLPLSISECSSGKHFF